MDVENPDEGRQLALKNPPEILTDVYKELGEFINRQKSKNLN